VGVGVAGGGGLCAESGGRIRVHIGVCVSVCTSVSVC